MHSSSAWLCSRSESMPEAPLPLFSLCLPYCRRRPVRTRCGREKLSEGKGVNAQAEGELGRRVDRHLSTWQDDLLPGYFRHPVYPAAQSPGKVPDAQRPGLLLRLPRTKKRKRWRAACCLPQSRRFARCVPAHILFSQIWSELLSFLQLFDKFPQLLGKFIHRILKSCQ